MKTKRLKGCWPLLLILPLASCGGGGDGGGNVVLDTLLRIASAQAGRVAALNAATTLTFQVTTRGGNPLSGKRVRLVAPKQGASGTFASPAPEGAHVFRGQTDANGQVTANLTTNGVAGVFLISAVVEGMNAAYTFAVSNVAAVTPTTLSAEQARAGIQKRLLGNKPEDETALLHGPVLLPAGAAVAAAGPSLNGAPSTAINVTRATWFFWLDEKPGNAFAHPTQFVLLDANDANAGFETRAQVVKQVWWPNVSLGSRYAPLYPAAQASDALPPTRMALPDFGGTRAPDDVCAILVYGPDGHNAFKNDTERYREFLTKDPPGRVNANRIFPNPPATQPTSSADLDASIQAAKNAGCKKIYYISVTHGAPGSCLLRKEGDPGNSKDIGDHVTYDSIAQKLAATNAEICAVIWACYADQAVAAFQNRGVIGQIAVASTNAETYYRHDDYGGYCPWNRALMHCWDDPNADGILAGQGRPKDGKVDILEAEAWVKQNPAASNPDTFTFNSTYQGWVMQGVPSSGSIGTALPQTYTLPSVGIVKTGQRQDIVIAYPPGVTPAETYYGKVQVNNPANLIAGFANGNTLDFSLTSNSTRTATLIGYGDGVTTYTVTGRTNTGKIFLGTGTISVGSTLQPNPNKLKLVVGKPGIVNVIRGGVLATLPNNVTVNVTSVDTQIATVATPALVFPAMVLVLPVGITAGFKLGTVNVNLQEAANGITGIFQVEVVQEVTLDRNLTDPTTSEILFRIGDKITTDRITGYRFVSQEAGCNGLHLHGEGGGIRIDGKGPFADPNPTGCGYGKVIQPP